MKKFVIIFAIFFFVSCVAPSQRRVERMDSWKGQNVNNLINSEWGYPDETKKAPNGNKLLIYYKVETRLKSKTVYKPQYSKQGALKKGTMESVDYTVEEHCSTFFEVDDSGKIVNVRWRGDGC